MRVALAVSSWSGLDECEVIDMEMVLVYVSLELGILVIASLDGDRKSVDPKLTPL